MIKTFNGFQNVGDIRLQRYDFGRPFIRFLGGGGGAPKLPPVAAPVPTPEDIDIQALQKGEAVRRRLSARRGRAGTILTESNLGTVDTAQKTILGG